MAELTYTNIRGEKIMLGRKTSFFISSIEGFSDVDNVISTSKAFKQDGKSIVSTSLDSRHLVISGEFFYKDIQEGRNKLISVFNPKLSGELVYRKGNTTRVIKCMPENSPIIPSSKLSTVPFIINLLASNPYWLSEDENETEIVSWIGGIKFPLVLPTRFSMAGEHLINIINSGDVATPIKLEIKGKATNPKITNTLTGEYIRINKVLEAEDTMTITTGFGNKRVEQNGVSVFNYIDLDSKFFSLDVGDNLIKFETESVNDEASIKISYRNRYIGV